MPERKNPHDPNAVAVHIDGHPVGHLPREDAATYRPVLQRLTDQGMVAQVGARVWASDRFNFDIDRRGNVRESADFAASVRLDLAAPHLLVPGTLPPAQAHQMLPVGGSIQVTGEEEHPDVLASYCGAAGEQWVHVTLHEITQQLARSQRTVVEVRIDDQRIGQLTPKMSGELLPALRHLADLGLRTGCRGMVKGNRAASHVTLHVQRSHQLDNGWFDQVARQ